MNANTTQTDISQNAQIVLDALAAHGLEGEPYIDVKPFKAWISEGRVVKKGEKAICTIKVMVSETTEEERNGKTVEVERKWRKPAHLFHISQTKPIER